MGIKWPVHPIITSPWLLDFPIYSFTLLTITHTISCNINPGINKPCLYRLVSRLFNFDHLYLMMKNQFYNMLWQTTVIYCFFLKVIWLWSSEPSVLKWPIHYLSVVLRQMLNNKQSFCLSFKSLKLYIYVLIITRSHPHAIWNTSVQYLNWPLHVYSIWNDTHTCV